MTTIMATTQESNNDACYSTNQRKEGRREHKSILTELMCYVQNRRYAKDHDFSTGELATLTPEHIYRWMCTLVYGTPDPTREDNPTHGRASSLVYYKKAISYFMPNKLMPWDAISREGNPTR
jgi:hypothetical protein